MRVRGLSFFFRVTVAFLSPLIAWGEESDSLWREFDEVVVTATRTPRSIKNVPIVTSLISTDAIKKSNSLDIKDLLIEELPGLEFGYAMSQETSLNMGGFGGNSILFLVDGERLAGETMNNIDYSRLNLGGVSSVEVVKGAASALYGANAVGGVVNLISKEETEPLSASLNSQYRAEGNLWSASGGLGFNRGKWASNTSVQYSTVETIDLTSAFDTASKIHKVYGGTTLNAKERITCRLSDTGKLTGRFGYFRRTNNRENYVDRYEDFSGGIKATIFNLELSYGYDRYDKARLVNRHNTGTHNYSNRQHILHALYSHTLGNVKMLYGADYMYDYLLSYQFKGNDHHSQSTVDAFAQVEFSPVEWLEVVGSVRNDYFSASRCNALTARVALMAKAGIFTLRGSYAGGFRAPTLKEMYMDFDMAGISMIYGNPDLKPERSHNFNLSLERTGRLLNGAYSITATGYFNYYLNRITVTEIDLNGLNPDGARYYNEADVKALGLDFSARYRSAAGPGAMLAMNLQHFSGNTVDSQFSPPRPFSAVWRVDYERRFSKSYSLYAALSGRYLAKPESRYPTAGAYSLLKLTLQQTIKQGLDVMLTVDNLLNYKPKVYYWNSVPTKGLTWSIGFTLNLNKFYGN